MMRSKVFSTLYFCFTLSCALAQQLPLAGRVISLKDSTGLDGCTVLIDNGRRSTRTDASGGFRFDAVPGGNHTLIVTHPEFKTYQRDLYLDKTTPPLTVALVSRVENLDQVTIREKGTEFDFTRMRGVENMGIYEGKKTEVILPEKLVANLATNNARQVFARVAGLNIYENDGAGIQLSIGGRGLDPNRTSNFNVRKNGYDISADALGYPESYYTPPIEAVGKIQIVRGAASLQYGTQFGGLLNFVMKKPVENRKVELLVRQSGGSFGFYNGFVSASGTVGKLSYYTFAQYKQGNGWRPNSKFKNLTLFSDVDFRLNEKTAVGIDLTHMDYLAQQPGGLSDLMFRQDPRQSNRDRNWFQVDWNLMAFHLDHKLNALNEFNLRVFGLSASRYSVGFRPNRVATVDDGSERDLIKGEFDNWGAEARYLKRYYVGKALAVLLVGTRYYEGFNHSQQGVGSTGPDADFAFVEPERFITYDYRFPNRNASAFVENVVYLSDKLSLTPGVRFEWINTTAEGYYGSIARDLAGNIISIERTDEARNRGRNFVLGGLGVSYKPFSPVDVYANASQNYRSITFSDMRISNPSLVIDPNLSDERGYSVDLGVRSHQTTHLNYDLGLFYLNYNNRIGEVQFFDASNRVLRRRGNVGQAVIRGMEAYAEGDLIHYLWPGTSGRWGGVVFGNLAWIRSEYTASETNGVVGNQVEFVPEFNLKSGLRVGYQSLKASFQYTHLSEQFTEATNAREGGVAGVVGLIPAYTILDASMSYEFKRIKMEASVNNIADARYFTRRATGYPGPGILPSDGRGYYLTLQVKL